MSTDNAHTRVELVRSDEEEKYLLQSPREIRQLLTSLVTGRALVSAQLTPGNQSFLTAVLGLADDDTALLLDGSTDESINTRIEQAAQITCITQLHNIRIQFQVENPARIQVDGRPAFRALLPDSVLRLQRREFYRLQTPVTQSVICELPIAGGTGGGMPVEVRIIDISSGGIAIAVPPSDFVFEPHMEFPGCTLRLPEAEPIRTRLVVRNLFRLVNRNGIEMQRAGCEFLDLPRNADSIIQRYILKIERTRNARERGNF
ncbi:MAG: flagellar brake protein [Azoarcus sp.]|uniref:Flagellar brake protein YcgR n=1 Tax=Parazoarcus communis TaxID=41977 RepID=A0A2U8GNH6_9RHOO|nr:flagellar brake protein [Parazoarcus communis]AWI75219.1 flagellar brake protein [Parazoarcus communis]PLX67387.1 MAG: flagellar brake protein [Azoarcus sp.]TVT52921.1 MAG: flagellar brake protein [Azoarcus sp. PHD]|tara:strand:- start:4450 stop:5229 length:780 start_codon:yes stop_codon:yes gene_type:complete